MNKAVNEIETSSQVKDNDRCKTCASCRQGKCSSEYSNSCNGYTHHREKWWIIFKDILLLIAVVTLILSPLWVFDG